MKISNLFSRPLAIPAGLYHYVRPVDGKMLRFHLRVDPKAGGLLVVNASAMVRLNASGVIIAKGLLDGDSDETIEHRLRAAFRGVDKSRAAADIAEIRQLIKQLESPDENYPVLNLSDPAFSPKVVPPSPPVAADVPLGTSEQMRQIFKRLWELGIPHVTIISGENPASSTLVEVVEQAEDIGLITGIRTRAVALIDDNLLSLLATAGIDHIDVFYINEAPEGLTIIDDQELALKTLKKIKQLEVCAVGQLVLLQSTTKTLEKMLFSLAENGIKEAAMFAIASDDRNTMPAGVISAQELPPRAKIIEELAERSGIRVIWQPTVRFNPQKPLMEQIFAGPRCGGDTSVRIELDGTIFLPRGPWLPVGNIFIAQNWSELEQNTVYQNYLRRITGDTHCDSCPGLAVCAADCPRDPAGWSTDS